MEYIMNTNTTTIANLASTLVYNNRFGSNKINGDQLGSESFDQWKKMEEALLEASYRVAVKCHDSALRDDRNAVDYSGLYNALHPILAAIGEVNGHRLYANAAFANIMVGLSYREVDSKSTELADIDLQLRNRRSELRSAKELNGVNPEYLEELQDKIDALSEKSKELCKLPDNKVKIIKSATITSFRLKLEHELARIITEQKAKTWEELEAEEEAKRQARRNRTAAKRKQARANKATADAKAEIKTEINHAGGKN